MSRRSLRIKDRPSINGDHENERGSENEHDPETGYRLGCATKERGWKEKGSRALSRTRGLEESANFPTPDILNSASARRQLSPSKKHVRKEDSNGDGAINRPMKLLIPEVSR